jgi:transcriptional regulator with XRE-family HTH domain
VADPDLKRLGGRLRRLRRERGLSLGEVAKATEISASFLSHIENGKSDITFMRLERLVALYGASLMDLAAPHQAVDDAGPGRLRALRRFGAAVSHREPSSGWTTRRASR